jgi:ribosomal protein L24
MKIELKVGDKVKVNVGKFAGKEDTVQFIDKKSKRVRLESLKKQKVKTKKGQKDLHGTFALANLTVLKAEAAAEAAQA